MHVQLRRILLHLFVAVCQNDNVKSLFKKVLSKTIKGHLGYNIVQHESGGIYEMLLTAQSLIVRNASLPLSSLTNLSYFAS